MKRLFRKLSITAVAAITAAVLMFGGSRTLSAYAADAPELVPYDVDGNGVTEAEETAYKLTSADELYWFAGLVNGTLEGVEQDASANAYLDRHITVNENLLTELIDVKEDGSGKSVSLWVPIGNSNKKYAGTFDGADHTISGLYFKSYANSVGLFGENEGTIKNVTVADSYFYGAENVSAICGYNYGTIENCSNTGTVEGAYYVGGDCGYNWGTIENCYNTGAVTTGSGNVGGICGCNEDGTIENCYNTGKVSGAYNAGSICGDNFGTITNSYYLDSAAEDFDATAKSANQFTNGEVCWLLNGGENQAETPVFYQDIGKDAYPVLDKHHTVIKDGESYKNAHNYENGFCTLCEYYEPAKAVTDEKDMDGDENTDETVYEISNAGQLYWFADKVSNDHANFGDKNVVLTDDITVNENLLTDLITVKDDGTATLNSEEEPTAWTPIGNKSSAYYGTFDGAGHTISGLYFSGDEKDYIGLFGYINDGSIKNVTVADSYFCSSASYAGGVCGYCKNGTIENCVNKGAVTSSYDYAYVGGVCGMSIDGNITKCTNMGAVTSTGDCCYVGGVCVWSTNNTITNCTNVGLITAKDATCVGGVSAYNDKQSMIADCINTGAVTLIVTAGESSSYIGGISAYNRVRSTIANCFSTGAVTINGDNVVGGSVCAYSSTDGKVTNCYFLKTDGLAGVTSDYGTAKTDEQFASGEVCWLLNGGANQPENPVFFQNLGTDADAFPVFDNSHSKVYKSDVCVEYSNIKDKKHTINPVAKVNATCETDGCEAYWYCSECKKYFANKDCSIIIEDLEAWKSKGGKIAKTGKHTGGTATCTEKAKCEICGAEYGTVEGHKYAEAWNFDAENHWHECEVCHDKKDAAAHTLVTTITNAGIGAEGKIETICTDCNNIIKTDLIPAIATVKLSQTSYTYNKKAQKPSVIVTDSEGTVIANTNYTVKYSSGRKKVGKYKVTVTFTGNYTGSVELTFTINPPKTSISKVKAGKKSFTVNWSKKTTEVTGYQIQYSTSSKFKTKTKTVTVKSAKDVTKTINKLSGNKKYYVRVRTYKTVGKTKYYSDWSSAKAVKTKK